MGKSHKLAIDWASVGLENTKGAKNSVDFSYKASVDDQPFQIVATIKLVPAGDEAIYKNYLAHSSKISGIKDPELDSTVSAVISDLFGNLTYWTVNSTIMSNASDIANLFHFVGLKALRIAGVGYTDGRSVFLEYSSKDIHLSSKNASA